VTGGDEVALVDRLRTGDEQAFVTLVRQHHPSLIRVASANPSETSRNRV